LRLNSKFLLHLSASTPQARRLRLVFASCEETKDHTFILEPVFLYSLQIVFTPSKLVCSKIRGSLYFLYGALLHHIACRYIDLQARTVPERLHFGASCVRCSMGILHQNSIRWCPLDLCAWPERWLGYCFGRSMSWKLAVFVAVFNVTAELRFYCMCAFSYNCQLSLSWSRFQILQGHWACSSKRSHSTASQFRASRGVR
jgi:hypothetical protein